MQTFEQYGFTLLPSENVSEDKYMEIKRGIEFVCRLVNETAARLKIKDAVFVQMFDFKDSNFLSICLIDGFSSFGIFNKNQHSIITCCDAEILRNLDEQIFDAFGERCHGFLHQISRGLTMNTGDLFDTWINHLQNKDYSNYVKY